MNGLLIDHSFILSGKRPNYREDREFKESDEEELEASDEAKGESEPSENDEMTSEKGDRELPSDTVNGANLKLVFDVEYRAPD